MIIGIDPDSRKYGVCKLGKNGNILALESLTLPELVKFIGSNKKATYVVEDINKIKAIYRGRYGAKDNQAVRSRMAQNIGMCKQSGFNAIELIESITGVKPQLAPVGLGKQFKGNAELFKEITGYQKRTNEDKRDAYAIAFWHYKFKK